VAIAGWVRFALTHVHESGATAGSRPDAASRLAAIHAGWAGARYPAGRMPLECIFPMHPTCINQGMAVPRWRGLLKMLRRPERMPYDRLGIAKVPPIKSA
jgi:hypothetical protein